MQVSGSEVSIKGPKGTLTRSLVDHVDLKVDNGSIEVGRNSDAKQARANHGLMRALVRNMVLGVSAGFSKTLEINGVGFRAEVRGKNLVMNLGYSHPVEYPIPEGITIAVDKAGAITVSGIDKQKVGQVAAEIRGFRKPDSYKGKGVRYAGEYIRLKAGKSAKK
jgi:large subunit ribosomal protein L6